MENRLWEPKLISKETIAPGIIKRTWAQANGKWSETYADFEVIGHRGTKFCTNSESYARELAAKAGKK